MSPPEICALDDDFARSPIGGPRRVGLRPGRPFIHRIGGFTAADLRGVRIAGLPPGLRIDPQSGSIVGRTQVRGEHRVEIAGEDADGPWTETITLVVGDDISLTPPLGWNSWNVFGPTVSEADVRRAATVLLDSGLADLGWTCVNIDDGWQGDRDRRGRLHPNEKFGDLADLAAHLHAAGLKIGIYSSPGPTTCAGFAGSQGHETEDAASFAAWGIDYLKYDWCSMGPHGAALPIKELVAPFARMRSALDRVDRDIIYHICEYGWSEVWTWARALAGANAWRTSGDIEDTWESVDRIGFGQAGMEPYAGPGGWNDPDMLVLGRVGGAWSQPVHDTRLTADEQRSHLGLWVLLSAPLLLGCDLASLGPGVMGMISNPEILAVHQDGLGRQARRMRVDGSLETWFRDLADGSVAVGVFNRGESPRQASIEWQELGLSRPLAVRNLWERTSVDQPDGWQALLPRHGSALLRVSHHQPPRAG